jgi:hypothetical protein
MIIRLPSLKSLRVFESVGRNLRFTLAAEDLNVTPSAISQQIRQLEDLLEVKLFKRWQIRRAELAGLCKITVVFGTHDAYEAMTGMAMRHLKKKRFKG